MKVVNIPSFRPLSGNLLSLRKHLECAIYWQCCFRPLSGNLLSLLRLTFTEEILGTFSSPIGESTFSTKINIHRGDSWNVFVPYRGIYFLYLFMQKHLTIKVLRVFVPYRGIYFLYKDESTFEDDEPVFSSPIGESTFSTRKAFGCIHPAGMGFSSPIGESTFSTSKLDENEWALLEVFVPYRGIYFLYLKIPARLRCRNMGFSSPIGESTFSTG